MITNWLQKLAGFSETDPVHTGVTRLPYSSAQKDAARFIKESMEDLGMAAMRDPYGTVAGIFPGKDKRCIIIGSHYDSVREGGIYDGCAGIALGLAVVHLFREYGEQPPFSIAVVAMNDEESILFQKPFLSSKTICEEYREADYCEIISREDGRCAKDLAAETEADCPRISLETMLKDAFCYIEPHVEQGPVLDYEGISFGLVEHIVGLFHCFYTIQGESNHAGTTPMHLRKDPLPAAGWIISRIPEIARTEDRAVATVGSLRVSPNVVNVIADQVEFSMDLRCVDMETLTEMKSRLDDLIHEAESRYPHLTFRQQHGFITPGVTMDSRLVSRLEQSLLRSGHSYRRMDSGAGHDAQIFAMHLPTAMLFLPSRGGYSHSRREFTEECYLQQAAEILKDFCANMTLL